jgi:hypothetical protein
VVALHPNVLPMPANCGDVWLRPSATREVGNYLDLTPPQIVGWQLTTDPVAAVSMLPVDGDASLFEQFTAAAAGTCRTVVDSNSRLQLRGGSMCGGDWPWQGLLSYERTITIEGGERIFTEPLIPIYMRDDGEGTVHIAAVLRHEGENEQVNRWLQYIGPGRRGWRLEPVRVNDEPSERHDEMWEILKNLGDEFLSARHPAMSAREKTAQAEATETEFRDFIKTVPYRTRRWTGSTSSSASTRRGSPSGPSPPTSGRSATRPAAERTAPSSPSSSARR